MKLNFNRQRVQNEQRLSGLSVLPLSGRQDLALIMLWPRTNFWSGKETDLVIKTHRTASPSPSLPPSGLSLSLPENCPLTHRTLRQEVSRDFDSDYVLQLCRQADQGSSSVLPFWSMWPTLSYFLFGSRFCHL